MTEEQVADSASDLRAHMRRTHQTAVYPFAGLANVQGLMYVGLGLAGEAGEIANQVKKIARDNGGMVTDDRRAKILDEMGDVMWYWLRLCHELGFDPYDVLAHNQKKLSERAATGTLQGDQRGALGREAAVQWAKDMEVASALADVFPVPAEAYARFIVNRSVGGGGTRVTCRGPRPICTRWAADVAPLVGHERVEQAGMSHIMAEHTPWGRAGRE